ncbi:hypothetical protein [Methylomicrobium lacus]|uniref:hypothetical protein n=1 Tax=Methylomicrobium lacus TaxID=136992 RepID=UPI0035A9256B
MDCDTAVEREEWRQPGAFSQAVAGKAADTERSRADHRRFRRFPRTPRGDGEPGAKTLWIGLQRVMDSAMGIRALQEIQNCV